MTGRRHTYYAHTYEPIRQFAVTDARARRGLRGGGRPGTDRRGRTAQGRRSWSRAGQLSSPPSSSAPARSPRPGRPAPRHPHHRRPARRHPPPRRRRLRRGDHRRRRSPHRDRSRQHALPGDSLRRALRGRGLNPAHSHGFEPESKLRFALRCRDARARRQPLGDAGPRLPRAVHGHPRRDDRQHRAADDPEGSRRSARPICSGSSTATRCCSAASCCSAAARRTSSAASGSSSPARSCSRSPACSTASRTSSEAADRASAPCRASAARSSPPPRSRSSPRPSRRVRSAPRRSASGARSPPAAAPSACCSAASSPRRSSWEWIFFVNVPIGAAAAVLSARLIRESKAERAGAFDVIGAVLVTAGLMVLVYAIVKAEAFGWGSARTLGLTAVGIVLLVAFVVRRDRASRARSCAWTSSRSAASRSRNFTLLLVAGGLFALFFFASLYVQRDPAASSRSRPASRSCR